MDEYYDKVSYLVPGVVWSESISVHQQEPYFHPYSLPIPATFCGTAVVSDSTIYKYYNSSFYFSTGSTSYLMGGVASYTNVNSLLIPALYWVDKSFTFEGWFYITTENSTRNLFTTGLNNSTVKLAVFAVNRAVELKVYNGSSTTPVDTITTGADYISGNTWFHVAMTRDVTDDSIELFVNGVSQGTTTNTLAGLVSGFYIGYSYYTSTTNRYLSPGYFNDFRITIDTVRYTTNFTPPGALLGTISGVTLDADGEPFSTLVTASPYLPTNDLTWETGSQVYSMLDANGTVVGVAPRKLNSWSTYSDATTGEFLLLVPKAEMQVHYSAPAGATIYNNITARVIPE